MTTSPQSGAHGQGISGVQRLVLVLWLIFIALPVLAAAWLWWAVRDRFGRCDLRPGYWPYAWHYHHLGPIHWWCAHGADSTRGGVMA